MESPTLQRRIIAAPMAGGISTPGLVAAVTRAGGFGFLAGGLQTAGSLASQMGELRTSTPRFGVNLFVPDPTPERVDLDTYREALRPIADRFGVSVPEPRWPAPDDPVDDDFPAKLDLLLRSPVEVVSFTFGLPDALVVEALHGVGSQVWATVTSPAEAIASWTRGVDALVVQGPDAGGHRGTQRANVCPDQTPLPELLTTIAGLVPLPLVAAGGVASREDVHTLLDLGASAVQVGTLLVRTPESGARQGHKDALAWPRETIVTRCFSGRWARSVRNEFTDALHDPAPGAHPQVAQLTAPIQSAAKQAGDDEWTQLWAGTGHLAARSVSAEEVVRDLLG